ncbi:MAG: pitrilysin family protein, partial [Myxococcales bacterium]
LVLAALVALASAPASVSAESIAAPEPEPRPLGLDIRRAQLPNGLRVVLAVDPTSPTVAVDVVYDVGARNEVPGRSGFAHLFEHMMFQGSSRVPRGEHFRLVTAHGGTLNGTTSSDRTNYFELLPRSELPLALWLEADRMKSLDISQSNFENQRQVVKEEYRMRIENRPYAPANIELQATVFEGHFPYSHATIGTMADLDSASLDWVRAFHNSYYAPNNAVLAIAGDIDPDETLRLVRQIFGDAKPVANVPKYPGGTVPEQTAERQRTVNDPHAKLPAVFYGWAAPASRQPEHYALELAAMALGDGESSRLYRKLAREQSQALEVDVSLWGHRGPDMFEIDVKLAASGSLARVQSVVEEEIDSLARNGPTPAELTKLRQRIKHGFLFGLQSNYARAQQLAEFELYWGDATLLRSELGHYLTVSADDIRRAVASTLTKARRSRIEVRPRTEGAAQ